MRQRVAGIDEAGRGPLAGPVVAAAVILRPGRPIRGVADSKVLSADERAALSVIIRRDASARAAQAIVALLESRGKAATESP